MTQHLCTDIAIYRLNWPQSRCSEKLPFRANISALGHILSSWTCCNCKYGCPRLDLAVLSLIRLQQGGGFTSQEHTWYSQNCTAGNTIPNSAQIHCGPLRLGSLGCSLTEGSAAETTVQCTHIFCTCIIALQCTPHLK